MDEQIEILRVNKLMSTDAQIELFDKALHQLLEGFDGNFNRLPALLSVFTDKTEEPDIMFGSLHMVEDYFAVDNRQYARTLINSYDAMLENNAKDWFKTLVQRLINSATGKPVFVEELVKTPEPLKGKVKGVLVEMRG